MKSSFYYRLILITLVLLVSCSKEITPVTPVAQNSSAEENAIQAAIVHSTVNKTFTILPLPSRNGDILSKTLTKYIDLNGDKTKDFAFTLYWSRWDYPYQNNDAATPSMYGTSGGDSVVTDLLYYTGYFGGNTGNFVRALPAAADIKSAHPYSTSALLATRYHVPPSYYSGGELLGKGDQLIAVKFTFKDGTTHFGWIRVNLASDGNSLTIADFAYNSVANETIAAGAF